ncbi:MAG TPA: hypothetical protein VMU59_15220 [Caulobacteraceae bacterium]|nr:hypothetical protein [Caulobacteraceae bacterium]
MDDNDGADAQDLAEAFDETHREGEDPNLFDREDALDPDLDSRAYDAVRADGEDEEDEDEDDDFDDDEDEDDEEDDDEVIEVRSPAGHEDERLDEGLEESFPASDPPAVGRPT